MILYKMIFGQFFQIFTLYKVFLDNFPRYFALYIAGMEYSEFLDQQEHSAVIGGHILITEKSSAELILRSVLPPEVRKTDFSPKMVRF